MADDLAFVVDELIEGRASIDGTYVLIAFGLVGGGQLGIAIPEERALELVGTIATAAATAACVRLDDPNVKQVFAVKWVGTAKEKETGAPILTFRVPGGVEFSFRIAPEAVALMLNLLAVQVGTQPPRPPPTRRRH